MNYLYWLGGALVSIPIWLLLVFVTAIAWSLGRAFAFESFTTRFNRERKSHGKKEN